MTFDKRCHALVVFPSFKNEDIFAIKMPSLQLRGHWLALFDHFGDINKMISFFLTRVATCLLTFSVTLST